IVLEVTMIRILVLALGFLAGPPADVFRFDSGGAHHFEGYGAWRVTVDREGNLAIVHQVADERREFPAVRLAAAEAEALWKTIDAAGLVESSVPGRPGVPDEVVVTFALEKVGAEKVSVKLWAADIALRPPLAILGAAMEALIAKHTGEKPVLSLPAPPLAEIVAGTWLDGDAVVTALFLAPESAGAVPVHVALAVGGAGGPGDYGLFPAAAFRAVELEPGAVTLLRTPLGGKPAPKAVLALRGPPAKDLDVHEIIDGVDPAGLVLFGAPARGDAVTVDRHLVLAGGRVEVRLAAPGGDFFHPEKMEIARVPRRIPMAGDDPEGPKGHVRVEWTADPRVTLLAGEAGEKRIRSHFTDPRCPWAERHVGWLADLFILEYREPAELRFVLDTTPVRRGGRIPDTWRGYGALSVESIYPNGFGGSSSNLDLPPVLVVPEGTPIREVAFR
ncbi:MAG: hypothetical protein MUE73_18905, partial [Planctomycetes bacterium]|nr:hypothetical protein [Planctomycetota bacterium]